MDKRQTITACVFLYRDQKVLIAKRADTKTFLPGKWELPGGHIEFGETIEQGLRRELDEEFNMEIILENPYAEFTYVMDDGKEHVVEVLYFARMRHPKDDIKIKKEDHSDYRWISESEIDTFFHDNDDEGKVIKKGFQGLNIKFSN